jgi:hypothetical protein
MDDCLRYALVSGKKALVQAGIGMGTEAFDKLDKQRCAAPLGGPDAAPGAAARQIGPVLRHKTAARLRKPF